jgi:hypothetical protein
MKTLGSWITDGGTQPYYARKEFDLEKEVASVTARVCGLGQFVFWLNGRKVDDHELDPGWTDYRRLIEYVSFDARSYLIPGRNAVGAEVGNGWFLKNDEHYSFRFPEFMPPNPNPYKASITSAHSNSGSFSSDDERYNQIYSLIEKAIEANMLSVHTDFPTIERFAWQEQNHLMATSITLAAIATT